MSDLRILDNNRDKNCPRGLVRHFLGQIEGQYELHCQSVAIQLLPDAELAEYLAEDFVGADLFTEDRVEFGDGGAEVLAE